MRSEHTHLAVQRQAVCRLCDGKLLQLPPGSHVGLGNGGHLLLQHHAQAVSIHPAGTCRSHDCSVLKALLRNLAQPPLASSTRQLVALACGQVRNKLHNPCSQPQALPPPAMHEEEPQHYEGARGWETFWGGANSRGGCFLTPGKPPDRGSKTRRKLQASGAVPDAEPTPRPNLRRPGNAGLVYHLVVANRTSSFVVRSCYGCVPCFRGSCHRRRRGGWRRCCSG